MSFQREPVRAPDFPKGFTWLGIDHPLSLEDLRGKLVLLDFWTYCCINCMHILPDLAYLEEKYAGKPFVVIGVHSAKFENEQNPENIREAMRRYHIHHPVVIDQNHRIWSSYAVRGWPTLVLIDPQGYYLGAVSGEGHRDRLDRAIGELLTIYENEGMLNGTPVALHSEPLPETDLHYPGKVLADAASNRLFIADSGYNRLIIATLDGKLLETIGTGEASMRDGSFEEATFRAPQGMALDGDILWVADTENHAIRKVDLKARTVTRVAGTGKQSHTLSYEQRGQGLEMELNSPWDLCLLNGTLFIAMAGPHQIWRYEPQSGEASVYAGRGAEARIDGPAPEAAFAQPSGITTDGANLYIADSEISCVRKIAPGEPPTVSTVVGGDLFEFGDRDGTGDDVRLQHPLGITWHDGSLLLADTYNHKIKTIDPDTRTCRTLLGTGEQGHQDGKPATFYEPSGVTVADRMLYIADTNNHSIRTANLDTLEVSTLTH